MFNRLFGLKCPDCGARFTEQDQYCPSCGADLDASNEQLSQTIAQQHLQKAQRAYDQGTRLRTALAHCDSAIEYDPSLAEAHNLRGLILDALGRLAESINSYQEAIRINPNFAEARENLAEAEAEKLNAPPEEEGTSSTQNHWPKIIVGAGCIAVIAAAIAGFYFLYKFTRPYFGPKTTIIFEPDRSKVSEVNPADLEKTAELLTERSQVLRYRRVSFVVANDGTIVCKVPSETDMEAFTKRVKAVGLLEFVDFGRTHISEGTLIDTDWEHKYFPQRGETKWHTIMTNAEIKTATLSTDQLEKYVVNFTLTDQGREIFYQYTTNNLGSYLGIVLDKVVISVPYVQGAIPDGQGQISGNFTKETAEELAMFLKMTPLPIPLKVRSGTNNNQ